MARTVFDFYTGWEQHNALLIKSIAPLQVEQLMWSPAEGLWSIRMLACHIVAARAWWFHGWMGEGDDDLRGLIRMDDDSDLSRPDASTICAALEKSWSDVHACLSSGRKPTCLRAFSVLGPTPRANARGETAATSSGTSPSTTYTTVVRSR